MVRFCQFRNLFGEVRTGVHAIRLFDFAVVDIILTVIGAYLISHFTKTEFYVALIGLFLLGIFLHWLFCVPTKLSFFSASGNR